MSSKYIMCVPCNVVALSTVGTKCVQCGRGALFLGETWEDAQAAANDRLKSHRLQSHIERRAVGQRPSVVRCWKCKCVRVSGTRSPERQRGMLQTAHPTGFVQPGVEVCLCLDRLNFNREEQRRAAAPMVAGTPRGPQPKRRPSIRFPEPVQEAKRPHPGGWLLKRQLDRLHAELRMKGARV